MMQNASTLELCAAALLLRQHLMNGHLLLSIGEDNVNLTGPDCGEAEQQEAHDGQVLRVGIERALKCCTRIPFLTMTDNTVVQTVASWLYTADLGQAEGKLWNDDDDCGSYRDEPDLAENDAKRALSTSTCDLDGEENMALHTKRRLVLLHNLHHASSEVQDCLVGALQHNALYGAGARHLKLLTVVATCSDKHMQRVSHRLRERFILCARVNRRSLPSVQQEKLRPQVQRLLASDPSLAAETVLGNAACLYPASGVFLCSPVHRYLLACVSRCKQHPDATLAVPCHNILPLAVAAVKAFAVVTSDRYFVSPEDVRAAMPHALCHKLLVSPVLIDEPDGPRLAPLALRRKDNVWCNKLNEDMAHGIIECFDPREPTQCSAAYYADAANASWNFITHVVGRIPVPQ
ncbi:hypothetical protein DIPPA_35593 [Diplonema papillatum]|nr:hypothetical protein DIPPA_35593 [Diplonema papillatum]